ncbi:MAG: hypothetical protein ACRDE5_16025 [Ginsengibacter sp.]
MQKKLNVSIYKNGTDSAFILDCVGGYNERKAEFSPRDVEGYINMRKAFIPTLLNDYCLIKGEEPNCYHVSEDGGKTLTLSLEWAEIYELVHDSEGENGTGC